MRKILLLSILGLVGCCSENQTNVPIVESREYRYNNGSASQDRRNLQWRLEQIEIKVDKLLEQNHR